MSIEKKINEYYEKFKGLPHKYPIVRNGITNDALALVVLDVLYKQEINIEMSKSNINKICERIVAPPDAGIDLFIEHEDGDEYYYDVIQVKYSELNESEITSILATMKRTIDSYCKNPKSVAENLRRVISNTNFDEIYKTRCNYYVVHKGNVKSFAGLRNNEKIITCSDLEIIENSGDSDVVPKETIKVDEFNNFIIYGQEQSKGNENYSYLCNFNGYDLALLNNKYSSTERGRNILFGENLRDSLESKSKTYKSMEKTIDKEPEKFWYYNNGITIISKVCNLNRDTKTGRESATIENFSIINGAQTTSSLGKYLLNAQINREEEKIENLKKVYVLTRILEVNDDQFRDNIAIYNNMQNPITTRDMVSNRIEQKKLQERLLDGDSSIYMEIRRGAKKPGRKQFLKHQETNNETLAQLAFSSFLRSPFTAKDKKKSLFNNNYDDEYTINSDYHKIFNFSSDIDKCGVLFQKSKDEIEELLFISYLYKESKKYLKNKYSKRLENEKLKLNSVDIDDKEERETIVSQISLYKRLLEINNICLFYNIALYYEFKEQYKDIDSGKKFDYQNYYNRDASYKEELIDAYASEFLLKTIDIIDENADSSNIGNWIRTKKSEELFLKILRKELGKNYSLETKYAEFVKKFKY